MTDMVAFIAENKNMCMRRALYALIILAASVLQNTRGFFPEIFSARAFLLIPVVICIAMFERDAVGAAAGFLGGALWDITSQTDGYFTVLLFLAGCVCGILINHYMRNNILTAAVLNAAFLTVFSVTHCVLTLHGIGGAAGLFFGFYLPSCIYTLLLMIPVYALIRYLGKCFRDSEK